MKMLDLHTHCLPCVDDGAKDLSESIAMLSDSFNQGVRVCAATPHCTLHRPSSIDTFLERRAQGMATLAPNLTDAMPKILLGAEVYLDNDINNYDGVERLCLEGTDYIMLEFPVDRANPRWAEWIYELNRKGIKVLVAHVDRYMEWEKMMADFKGLDVKYQVNASRFLESMSGKLIKALMAYGHDYVISSDMHNTKFRSCNMGKAYEKAKKKFGDKADALFCANGSKIIGIKPEW